MDKHGTEEAMCLAGDQWVMWREARGFGGAKSFGEIRVIVPNFNRALHAGAFDEG